MNFRLLKDIGPRLLLGALLLLALSGYRTRLIREESLKDLHQIADTQLELSRRLGGMSSGLPTSTSEVTRLLSGVSLPLSVLRLRVFLPQLPSLVASNPSAEAGQESRQVQLISAGSLPSWASEAALEKEPASFLRGKTLELVVPLESAQGSGAIYSFDASRVFYRLLGGILLCGAIIAGFSWFTVSQAIHSIFRLRMKFVAAIVAINLITASIIFWSLLLLQTREQTSRIERQSLIHSRFATESVIRSFVSFYKKSYFERFLPDIKSIVASDEDLSRIRILSVQSGNILFDSELESSHGSQKAEYPREMLDQLAATDQASRSYSSSDGGWFSVLNTFRSPAGEPLFRVEFLYGYRSLERSLEAIRSQILFDLVPALAIGVLIAMAFAQFLISPIRRLVSAFGKVSAGDLSTSVSIATGDELAELGSAFNSMTMELKRKQELRKYLSRSSYEQITRAIDLLPPSSKAGGGSDSGLPRLGGVRTPATILFCDIRDFVSHCEALDAEEVTSMLNEYFSEMVAVIHKNGGEVDKFIGDAILAVFYPEAGKASESATSLQAVYCALEMRARLAVFNAKRDVSEKRRIDFGIGLSFGEIISGPIGAENRLDFTVIGDVVNQASRIEKLSKQGRFTKILFSQRIEKQIEGLLLYEEIAEGIRGKSEEVRVFELVGIRELSSLVENLESPDTQLRARSVEILGHSGNHRALSIVLGALKDRDESVRGLAAAAVSRLAPMNDTAAVGAVLESLKNEASPRVASALITCLGKICQDERVLGLTPWLASQDDRIVANAVEAIGQARIPQGTDLILSKLDSRNHRIKANAAMAAFSSGRFEVINILKPMLMHSDPLMRSSAAFAIGELSRLSDLDGIARAFKMDLVRSQQVLGELQECVPMLVALLKDPETVVKRQAVIALGKIKDRSSLLPLIGLIDTPEVLPDVLEALRTIGSHRIVRDILQKFSQTA